MNYVRLSYAIASGYVVADAIYKGYEASEVCIFSSAVYGENPRYCYRLGIVVVHMKTLWHFVISVITEDIYFKLGVCVHHAKSNPYYQGRQVRMHFFTGLCPFFNLRLFILYQAPHTRALAPACHALVIFFDGFCQPFMKQSKLLTALWKKHFLCFPLFSSLLLRTNSITCNALFKSHFFNSHISMGECNTILSAYTLNRHLG